MKKAHVAISVLVGLILYTASATANEQPLPAIDMSGPEPLKESVQAMEETLPPSSVREEAFRQALVFVIFDFKLAEAVKSFETGGPLPQESLAAHGMTVTDLYAHAVPYWQQELSILQQAAMIGELRPDVTLAEAQAHLSKLQQMIALGSRPDRQEKIQ